MHLYIDNRIPALHLCTETKLIIQNITMKQILSLIIAVLSVFTSFASEEQPLVVSAGQFKHIELGNDMKVTLISKAQLQNEIKTGSVAVFEKLDIAVSGNNLRLDLRQKLEPNEKIYVVVGEIETLTLGENTFVESENVLPGKEIKLSVDKGASAHLKTSANVTAIGADGLPVKVITKSSATQKDVKAF